MTSITINTNLKQLAQQYGKFGKDVRFGLAKSLTRVAKEVQKAQIEEIPKQLDRPKPFTMNAIRVRAANKKNLTATVFMMDKTAWYLEPYEFGGKTKLNKGAKSQVLPVTQKLDQYGNIPRMTIGRLSKRKDIFIGEIKTKNGTVKGVFQRPHHRGKGQKRGSSKITKLSNTTGKLKILMRFVDPHQAKQEINYMARAKSVIEDNFERIFDEEMAAIIAKAQT